MKEEKDINVPREQHRVNKVRGRGGGWICVYFYSATWEISRLPMWQLRKGGKERVMSGAIVPPPGLRLKREEGIKVSFQ